MSCRFVGLSSMTRMRAIGSPPFRLSEHQPEHAPGAGLALEGDSSSEKTGELLAEVKPQARALVAPARTAELLEGLEEPYLVLRLDAHAGVAHRQLGNPPAGAVMLLQLQPH